MIPRSTYYQPTPSYADLVQAVYDLHHQGMKPYDISAALGIGLGAVTDLLGTLGTVPMRASP